MACARPRRQRPQPGVEPWPLEWESNALSTDPYMMINWLCNFKSTYIRDNGVKCCVCFDDTGGQECGYEHVSALRPDCQRDPRQDLWSPIGRGSPVAAVIPVVLKFLFAFKLLSALKFLFFFPNGWKPAVAMVTDGSLIPIGRRYPVATVINILIICHWSRTFFHA